MSLCVRRGVQRDIAERLQRCILRFSPLHVGRHWDQCKTPIHVLLRHLYFIKVSQCDEVQKIKNVLLIVHKIPCWEAWQRCVKVSFFPFSSNSFNIEWFKICCSPEEKKTHTKVFVSEERSPLLNACVRLKFMSFPGEMMVFEHAVRTSLCFV